MTIHPVPADDKGITPHISVHDAAAAIEFYRSVFGAEETMRIGGEKPGEKVGHAELRFGEARLMINDEYPEYHAISPKTLGGTAVALHLYVTDVDAVVARAVAAGATQERPISNEFYGDRVGWIRDPFGHRWTIASRIEDVSPEEMKRRAAQHK